MPTRECSRCSLTQTLWCGGSSTCKSSLAWPACQVVPDCACHFCVSWETLQQCGSRKECLRGNLLDITLNPWLTWCGLNKHPELNLKESKRNDRQTHTHTETYTHLPLRHWNTVVNWHLPTYRAWLVHLDPQLITFYWYYMILPNKIRLSLKRVYCVKNW
jgi:hypothetical protein